MSAARRRSALTLVELLIIAIPALLVFGLVLHLVVRGFATERWNAGRLSAVDAVLIAGEHVRADLAASSGLVELEGGTLSIRTGDALEPGPRAVYAPVSRGCLERNGKPVRAAPLSRAGWAWDPAAASLLRVELAAGAAGQVTHAAAVHLPDRAARMAYPGFADR